MTALPVIQADGRVACTPYRARLTPGQCAKRQELARKQVGANKHGSNRRLVPQGDYFECRNCPIGAAVVRELAARG